MDLTSTDFAARVVRTAVVSTDFAARVVRTAVVSTEFAARVVRTAVVSTDFAARDVRTAVVSTEFEATVVRTALVSTVFARLARTTTHRSGALVMSCTCGNINLYRARSSELAQLGRYVGSYVATEENHLQAKRLRHPRRPRTTNKNKNELLATCVLRIGFTLQQQRRANDDGNIGGNTTQGM
jgi:hypothetical protein